MQNRWSFQRSQTIRGAAATPIAIQIHQRIVNLMNTLGGIEKGEKHYQGYKYRSIDQLLDRLQPALIEHTLHMTVDYQLINSHTDEGGSTHVVVQCQLAITDEEGAAVLFTALGEGIDKQDKAIGKAMSYAYKYAIFHGLCVPVAKGVLADADHPDPAPAVDPVQERVKQIMESRNK